MTTALKAILKGLGATLAFFGCIAAMVGLLLLSHKMGMKWVPVGLGFVVMWALMASLFWPTKRDRK